MPTGMQNFDYDIEGSDLKRRQAVYDAMQAGALQPMQFAPANQGGQASPTHWTNALAKVMQGYVAKQGQEKVKEQQQALSQRYGDDLRTGMEAYERTSRGYEKPYDPAIPEDLRLPGGMDRQAGDPRKAIFDAMASNHPVLRDFAMKQLAEQSKGQLTPVELAKHATSDSILKNPNDPRTWAPQQKLVSHAPGSIMLDEGGKLAVPGGTTLDNPGWKTVNVGGDLYQQTATGLKKLDNAPKVTVNSSTLVQGQKAGTAEWFKNTAQQVDALGKEANSSQRLLVTLGTLQELHKAGINSNVTAPMVTAASNLAQSLGVKIDPSKLGNTEAYNSLVTDLWQRSVAQYGGNKGVTSAEAEEIKKLTPLATYSPQAREQLFAIQSAVAKRSIEAYKQANSSFAQAAAADDPRLYKIPEYLQGAYTPPAGNESNPNVTGSSPKRIRFEDM